jgi:hypothetical protein
MENVLTETVTQPASSIGRRLIWPTLFVLLPLSIALVAIPVFLIQPFRPQTQRGLEISYALRSWSPLVTALILFAAIGLVFWQWRRIRRWWQKALLAIPILLLIGPVWFARQNHFEWMFNPLHGSAYVNANNADFVRDADMVLAVKINNEAVAYPVRLMAYHHIVQDTVGGTPICATY